MDQAEELITRARADLARQEAAESRAIEALERAREEQVKLRGFIETLEKYLGISPAQGSSNKALARGSRSRDIVDKAVELLFFNDRPLEIGNLADLIEIEGLSIAGQNRNATLAGYLSRDERVEFVRGAGWKLTQAGLRSVGADGSAEIPKQTGSAQAERPALARYDDLDDDIPF